MLLLIGLAGQCGHERNPIDIGRHGRARQFTGRGRQVPECGDMIRSLVGRNGARPPGNHMVLGSRPRTCRVCLRATGHWSQSDRGGVRLQNAGHCRLVKITSVFSAISSRLSCSRIFPTELSEEANHGNKGRLGMCFCPVVATAIRLLLEVANKFFAFLRRDLQVGMGLLE